MEKSKNNSLVNPGGAWTVCTTTSASPDIAEVYENNMEISRYSFPPRAGYRTSEPTRHDIQLSTNSFPATPPLSQYPHGVCCCHNTHNHHNTIITNGYQIDAVRGNNSAARYLGHLNTAVSSGNQNSNNDSAINNDESGISNSRHNRTDYRYQKPASNADKKCCGKPSVGVLALLTVLILVILSLLSGLIYFLVRGNVSTTDSSSSKTSVPSVPTVLNQTTICGQFPEKYLSLSSRTVNPEHPFSNLHPPKDDHRINSSLASRIIGGVPANIVQYPWQIVQSTHNSKTPDDLIDPTKVQGRIFGGSDIAATRFPWQVHLKGASLWENRHGIKCGGSLIMNEWVLTAAHCTESNQNPNDWTAYMGMSILKQKSQPPAQSSAVIAIIQHEQYVHDFTYDYDVSLLKLKTPMKFSPSVQPICLPEATTVYKVDTECYISGWGATTNTGLASAPPNLLQHAQVDIIGLDVCNDWLEGLITDRMICAGKEDGTKDACQGDSGGPLSCYDDQKKTWTLAGSVSWGIDCGQPEQPGVYAKMPFFVDWIWNKIGRHEGWIEGFDNDVGLGSGT